MNLKSIFGFILLLYLFGGLKVFGFQVEPADSSKPKTTFNNNLANRLLNRLLEKSENQFFINGQFNPYAIYRKLDNGYTNTDGGLENLSLAPYPNFGSTAINTLQPTLLLSFGGSTPEKLSFAIDYAFFYNYNSKTEKSQYDFLSQNNLVAHLGIVKAWGNLKIAAGAGVIPVHFSALTLSNKYIREALFDRVPWEYHSNTRNRYLANFQKSNFSPGIFNQTGTQGFLVEGEKLPLNVNFKAFYGRTQLNLFPDAALAGTPSEIAAIRLGKNFSGENGLAINLYNNNAWSDKRRTFHDVRNLVSIDGFGRIGNSRILGELGIANLKNPKVGQTNDFGGTFKLSNSESKFPFTVQLFALGKNFVCLENEAFNSNEIYRQGGLFADSTYNNFLFQGYLNSAGTLANNRLGLDLAFEKKHNRWSIGIGHQISREMEQSGSVISFPHFVNGYSRSRFSPWQQFGGPYKRIGNRFRMSIERVNITQDADKLKFMSSTFLDVKSRMPIQNQNLYICSYSAFGTIGTSPYISYLDKEKGFLNTFFQELEIMIPIGKKIFLVGYGGLEINQASQKTELSTENQKPLSQFGSGYGLGFDVELADNAGLYFRHRWMDFKDKSFEKDQFSGQESVVELKIGF
jgi:hypothetical protein